MVERVLEQQDDNPGGALGRDAGLLRWAVPEGSAEVLAYGYLARSAWQPPHHWQTQVLVRPSAQGQGLGQRLAATLGRAAHDAAARQLTTWVDGAVPRDLRFARAAGFVEVQRFVAMSLSIDPWRADEQRLHRALARAAEHGIEVFAWADTPRAETDRHRLYELNRRLAPLIPGNGPDFPTYAEYVAEVLDARWFRPEGQLIAADRASGRWVGLVGLGRHGSSDGDGGAPGGLVRHEFTAVDPAWQRRGVGAALKARAVLLARDWGAHRIDTGNDDANRAIIALNESLGYVARPGVVTLRRGGWRPGRRPGWCWPTGPRR